MESKSKVVVVMQTETSCERGDCLMLIVNERIFSIENINETLTLISVVVLLLDNQVHCYSGLNCRLKLI